MNRRRKHREVKLPRKQVPLRRSLVPRLWLKRRFSLIMGSIVASLALLGGGYIGYQKVLDTRYPARQLFPAAIATAAQRGSLVFDHTHGTPERLLVCLKQHHGSADFADFLRSRPDRFTLFIKHHDALRSLLEEQLHQTETDRIHFFLEGFIGERATWGKDVNETLSQVVIIDRALQNARTRQTVLQQVEQMLDRPSAEEKRGALYLLNGGGRFAANHALENSAIIHGADPPGHVPLTQTRSDVLHQLAQKEQPTEAEIQATIQQIEKATDQDEQLRHRYLRQQIQAHVPPGGIGVIVLGLSHFAAGANYENASPTQPLEQELAKLPNTRTVVIEESHLPALLAESPNSLAIGRKIKPEHLRRYLLKLRQNQEVNQD